jgi:hypothetical protein
MCFSCKYGVPEIFIAIAISPLSVDDTDELEEAHEADEVDEALLRPLYWFSRDFDRI